MAKVYAGEDNIVNLIQMKNPTMVNLSALVIDISGKDASDLGFKYGVASDVSTSDGHTSITFGTAGASFYYIFIHIERGHCFIHINLFAY